MTAYSNAVALADRLRVSVATVCANARRVGLAPKHGRFQFDDAAAERVAAQIAANRQRSGLSWTDSTLLALRPDQPTECPHCHAAVGQRRQLWYGPDKHVCGWKR
jgi:hypothetical protein